jgi:translation initiation factor 1 (eIF-1/SUI1)
MKVIKGKLACGGTLKDRNIEVLFGRNDRSSELIQILVEQGFKREAIHVSKGI